MNEWGWENSCSHHSLIKKKTHSWAPTVCQAVSGLGTQAWTGQRQPHVLVGETESKNCNQEWPSGEGTILSRVVRKDPLPGKKLKKKKICIKGDFPGGTLHFQCREHRFYHWLVNKKPIYLGEPSDVAAIQLQWSSAHAWLVCSISVPIPLPVLLFFLSLLLYFPPILFDL